ncbi:Nucleotide-binding universal stress protein, UspA family [Salinimicrobium sediminis]|uniref:Nucleotide-binding universal stress protein, UspA family n=1 Tax=Salinimicrobium sediminis TaxID=1343891 RepID=A0A285X1K1_9FLAO|nr:universal stress protein [Salinimicrobium sediminis]SOC79240.1 Nucleotide-binding universal stress protein, UspA family [Salinimicrobium sediminis]
MKNILIPFDFSEVSKNALEYAVRFADHDPAITLFLLNITDGNCKTGKIEEDFKKIIKKYQKPQFPEIHTLVREGEFAPSIIQLQKELKIDLIIMGTRGAQTGEENIATTTSRLVQEADLPVLVIPGTYRKFRLSTIILSLGNEKITDRTPLYTLLDVSRKHKAQVHVLTIQHHEMAMGYTEDDESNEATLNYFLEMFYSHHSFEENEDIEKGILNYIEKHDMDMLAIMPRTHLPGSEASEGRLTRLLTLHSNVPLLVLD